MKKAMVLLPIILILTFLVYFYGIRDSRKELSQGKVFAGVAWPEGTKYEVLTDGNLVLEIKEDFNILKGEWKSGTRFYLDGDEVQKILATSPFRFAQMEFSEKTMITAEKFPPNILHKLQVNKEMIIDGLDLKKECIISFKNYVLFSADCPGLDTLYFKRFLELPEVAPETRNSEEEKS